MRSSQAFCPITFALSEIAFVFDLTTQHDEAPPTRKNKLILRLWVGPARQTFFALWPRTEFRNLLFNLSPVAGRSSPATEPRRSVTQRRLFSACLSNRVI